MKKRWLLYVTFGFVFYLIFLIVQMPASWFAWAISRFTNKVVHLDPIAGNFWRGTGRLVIYYPQGMPHNLGNAEWSINPLWLFIGKFQIYWQTDSERKINSALRFGANQIQILDTDVTLPASIIGTFYPPASLISPEGKMSLRTDKLSLAAGRFEGNAEIQWQNASSSLSPVQPLGTYRLEIKASGENAALQLKTIQGALDLSGQGQWQTKTGMIQFNGLAFPRERAEALEPLLKMLGEDQGNGRRTLILNNHLPIVLY